MAAGKDQKKRAKAVKKATQEAVSTTAHPIQRRYHTNRCLSLPVQSLGTIARDRAKRTCTKTYPQTASHVGTNIALGAKVALCPP